MKEWIMGKDYPSWGNNERYLATMRSYCDDGETPRDLYRRLASTCEKYTKLGIEEKIFKIFWNGWLIPSTPVAKNFGNNLGFPISCFSGVVGDSMLDINEKSTEMSMLSKYGGGTAYDFSQVRPTGSLIKSGKHGVSDGVIPFLHSYDSTILHSKQGDTRRGAVALYLDIEHGDADDFLRIRESKGDINRQCRNSNHGFVFPNSYMEALHTNKDYFNRWVRTIRTRIETGQPYMFFKDNANRNIPKLLAAIFKKHKLSIKHSNLCTEIMLPTDELHTLVCCLSSLNLYKWDEYGHLPTSEHPAYLATIFLDSVISEFLDKAKNVGENWINNVIRFAEKSRALGLGTLGWHTLLQSKKIPFVSIMANSLTRIIFSKLKTCSDKASEDMAKTLGEPEWCKGFGVRNLTKMAIAPNRSSSKLAGGISQGIEPFSSVYYTDRDSKGVFFTKNPIFVQYLDEKNKNNTDVWNHLMESRGDLSGLKFMSSDDVEVFKSFKDINQVELVKQAALRQQYIDQGQSINVSFHKDAPASYINETHYAAWKLGNKSLYYLRSESTLTADSKSFDEGCVMCEG